MANACRAVTDVACDDGAAAAPARDVALDAARGAIVALMALDHVRMFFSAATFDPLDLERTSAAWFAMRWITHLCAPGFFFIAGVSVWLQEHNGASRRSLQRSLLVRGSWLIALELLVFGFAWSFDPDWRWLGVIWGLGASMLVLAFALRVPKGALLAAAGLFTVVHSHLAPALLARLGNDGVLLYRTGILDVPWLGPTLVIYPLLPWLALMVLGYALAPSLFRGGRLRRDRAALGSVALILAFVVLRTLGVGEIEPGDTQARAGWRSVLQFLDVEKYPPSTQYSLVTLGVLGAFTAGFGRRARADGLLATFGRVPLFFYALHLFLIHGLAWLTAIALGWPTEYLFWRSTGPNLVPPAGYGFGLWGCFAAWLLVLAILWPLCRAFGAYQRAHRHWLLKLL